jgi:hypothetical protein
MSLVILLKISLMLVLFLISLVYVLDLISNSINKDNNYHKNSIEISNFNVVNIQNSIFYSLFSRNKQLIKIIVVSPTVIILLERFYSMFQMHIYKRYEDFLFFYAVGSAICKNLNPYLGIPDPTNIESSLNFPYLPNSFVLLAPLGLLDINLAFIVFRLIGIISIFFFCLAITRLLNNYQYLHKIIIFVFISFFGLFFDVLLGNISTITIALIAWFVVFLKEKKQVGSSIFLALSTIKPTLCIFFFLMLLIKKEFRILFLSLSFSAFLIILGLFFAGVNPFDLNDLYNHFLQPWRNAINTNIDNNIFGSEYLSKSRIDIGVIGARIFKEVSQANLAALLSGFVKVSLILLAFWRLFIVNKSFNKYKLNAFKELDELIFFWNISMVSILNIICNYSQNTNNSMLFFSLIFLILYKCFIYKYSDMVVNNNFRLNFVWGLAMFCVFLHTVVSYNLFGYLFGYDDNYLQSISIGFLPNISIVFILIIISSLPIPSMKYQTE